MNLEELRKELHENIEWLKNTHHGVFTRGMINGYENVLWWMDDMKEEEE